MMARCSRVCGMTPSSAATTSKAKSMPPAPASMVWTKLLVAGHVDEAEHRPVRRRQIGEAEIDGDAARLFLLQPIAIDAGQRFDQRGLAMIDMAGGADDHGDGSGSERRGAAFGLGDFVRRQCGAGRLEERLGQARCRRAARAAATPAPPRRRAARRRRG